MGEPCVGLVVNELVSDLYQKRCILVRLRTSIERLFVSKRERDLILFQQFLLSHAFMPIRRECHPSAFWNC